jgi:hypothetical protein
MLNKYLLARCPARCGRNHIPCLRAQKEEAKSTYQALKEAPKGLPSLLRSLLGLVPILQWVRIQRGWLHTLGRFFGFLFAALVLVHLRDWLLVLCGALFGLLGGCCGFWLGGCGGLFRGVWCLRQFRQGPFLVAVRQFSIAMEQKS